MGRYYAALQGEDRRSRQPSRSTTSRSALPIACRPLPPGRGGARRQARHARRLLGHRREADRLEDPYALRRAALGVIRLILENQIPINLRHFLEAHFPRITKAGSVEDASKIDTLLGFLEERLAVQLREQGARHDLLDAVQGNTRSCKASSLSGWSVAWPRSGASSTPRTARTCWPATAARRTSCGSRRRRTGRPTTTLRPRTRAVRRAGGAGARRGARAGAVRGLGSRAERRFRARHAGAVAPAPAGRCVLRQGDCERR